MNMSNPECFGKKRCPKAPNNVDRVWCPEYEACLDELVRADLFRRKSPTRIADYLRGFLGDSDFMVLIRIGRVACESGFHFGRKKIDRAIAESDIGNDGESAEFERREVRRTFGVFGREGAHRARSVPIGRTQATTCEGVASPNEQPKPDIVQPLGDGVATDDRRAVRSIEAVKSA